MIGGNPLSTYNLKTPIGPIAGARGFDSGPFNTNAGALDFTGVAALATFTAAGPPLLPDLCPTDPISGDCFFGYDVDPPTPPPGYYWTPILPMYDFPDSPRGNWFDPAGASGYLYEMTGGSLFTSLDLPTGFDQPFYIATPGCTIPGTFEPGQSADFLALCGRGVSEFAITGIGPSFDPTNSGAFPIELAFNTPTANFIAEPLESSPEPGATALFGIGLAFLAALKMGATVSRPTRTRQRHSDTENLS